MIIALICKVNERKGRNRERKREREKYIGRFSRCSADWKSNGVLWLVEITVNE